MPKPKKKTKQSSIDYRLLACKICTVSAALGDFNFDDLAAEYRKRVRCPICNKSFKLCTIQVEHTHLPGPDFQEGKWSVTYEVAGDAMTELFIGTHMPELTATAHTSCVKKAMPHWPKAAHKFPTLPTAEELADKMIANGAHLTALVSLKERLGVALAALLKNVAGSSSEYGCPCASRVSATLNDIADKFQQDEQGSGI